MLLLFDLDGTLIDSVNDIATAANELRAWQELSPLEVAAVARLVGGGVENLVRQLLRERDKVALDDAIARYRRSYQLHCLEQTRPYPGVSATLARIRDRLDARSALGVISNKPEDFSRTILGALDLLPFFALVVGGDTICPSKPDPAPLAYAMRHLRAQPRETWMVGDSPSDIQAGRAAGTRTVAVTYGLRPRQELERLAPDRIIDRFADLPHAIGIE